MSIKKFFGYASIIFLILYVLGGIPESMASPYRNEQDAINQFERNDPADDHREPIGNYLGDLSDLLNWKMEVNDRVFQIFVDRDNEVIIVRGEADDYKLEEKVENYVKARAPSNFRIIYNIDVFGTPERNRRGKSKQG